MKKITFILFLCAIILSGCGAKETSNYVAQGNYYSDGTVITNDGNIWDYQTEMSNGNVHVVFNDNGTTNNIYDDIIVDLIKVN